MHLQQQPTPPVVMPVWFGCARTFQSDCARIRATASKNLFVEQRFCIRFCWWLSLSVTGTWCERFELWISFACQFFCRLHLPFPELPLSVLIFRPSLLDWRKIHSALSSFLTPMVCSFCPVCTSFLPSVSVWDFRVSRLNCCRRHHPVSSSTWRSTSRAVLTTKWTT